MSVWICVLFTCPVLIFGGTNIKQPLKVASFNIQVFGQTKIGKDDVVDTLVQVKIYIL